ncbi:GNAT family N-acetyltransferase [Chenggangzhangella methanolivorans]|uniref:GNAT family N-acetyltransferase n=1 Tax=Chenggangzhangella methanolivorans TaxID=1437009 RepID=A0A9E6RDG2_9HYPH|nr:GNAT family protein [Chenggangzhangella methanolivorans]QZO01845.1 GNAT family N-acetyltransferase [Chenggangzhangella methanolivorans]
MTTSPTDPDLVPPRGLKVEGPAPTRPTPVRLEGRHVVLGPLDPEKDAADLYAPTHGEGREARFAYLFDGPFESEAAMAAALKTAAAATDVATLAIRDKASGKTLGRAGFMRVDLGHRTVEVGSILFSPALSRTPAATEAMYLMAAHAFSLGFRRYEWKCDALNAPSRAAALRYGFRFEGIFRKHMVIKGRSRDTSWFAMTEDDWPAVRAAFEAWLKPENFDADGRQLRKLAELRGDG